MGIAQLIRTLIVQVLHMPVPAGVDLSGIIYFIMNIPLFYMGYRVLGSAFAVKTLVTVGIQSVFLTIVPIPAAPIVDDYLTSCIIGGIVAGTGTGLIPQGTQLRRRAGHHRPVLHEEVSGLQRGQGQYHDERARLRHLPVHVQH